jgi:hypothetical protein
MSHMTAAVRAQIAWVSNFWPLDDNPDVRVGVRDVVANYYTIEVGPDELDDKEHVDRARSLLADWLLALYAEGDSRKVFRTEQVEAIVCALLARAAKADQLEQVSPCPDYCPHCAAHMATGRSRAELERQRAERAEIEDELRQRREAP